MRRREFLKMSLGAAVATGTDFCHPANAASPASSRQLPDATASRLPRWHGFNLLEKFMVEGGNKPYLEHDFEWMATWGFDFVRLPMDYRCWAKTPDTPFNEATMRDIDQAVEFGRQHGIHVNLNFHRAPGYCVNAKADENTLWTDPAMQEQFARHWSAFSTRYKGVPSRLLSFNLVNEPAKMPAAGYAVVVRQAVDAIRAADPTRLIIADGLNWGNVPVAELVPLGIAQSMHCYEPMRVTHYQAPWIHQNDENMPPPAWPVPVGLNGYIFCEDKPDLKSPLVLKVNCAEATRFSILVGKVSARAELIISADGAVIFHKTFAPGPGPGEWKSAGKNQWGGYDADYDIFYPATIPAGTRELRIEGGTGDWLRFKEIWLGSTVIRPESEEWGIRQQTFSIDASTGCLQAEYPRHWECSKETLRTKLVEPWKKLAATGSGVGVHIGECGVFNRTPHAVALAWMKDNLENWKSAGFGWALWNFRGSFGILDSERRDVSYENFQGRKLDRRMLELLREYL